MEENDARSGLLRETILSRQLVAYRVTVPTPIRVVPAPHSRAWMDTTHNRFAHRCLPILMANQAGWLVLNGHDVEVTWDGNNALSGIYFEWLAGLEPYPAVSHFGYGLLT
jgi:hypothetical protein